MSALPPDSERVVITATEVAQASTAPAPRRALIPWWTVLIGSLLAVCLPLLCIFAIGVRIALRARESQLRAAWNRLLCTLLIVSGLASSIVWSYLWFLRSEKHVSIPGSVIATSDHLDSLDGLPSFPDAPAAQPMSGVEIAEWSKPLVVIVTRYTKFAGPAYLDNAGIGAAMLLMADENGYLFGTNRHVVEQSGVLDFNRKRDQMLVFTKESDSASAEIAGRHRTLDLALLWTPRKGGSARFRQPIAPFRSVLLGSGIFVIGHPQRLFFTLSNGLISRLSGNDMLQISAPISPGNSGGPVYDIRGNLLGVVTYKMDRESNPNAENLNFATRADAFLSETGWDLADAGRAALKRLAAPIK